MSEHEQGDFRESVHIEFDCIPMRTVSRLDSPVDASPALEQLVQRMRESVEKHGTHNSYYLHRGRCQFFLTNDRHVGCLDFQFDGVLLTDEKDQKTRGSDLTIHLTQETCSWLNQEIVTWFEQTVTRAVEVEFDRYIAAGDLEKTQQRLAEMEQQEQANSGFLGMYL